MCIRRLLPLAMCTTTMDARITTTAARTSVHPSLRAAPRILRRVIVIRIAVNPFERKKIKNSPGFSGAVLLLKGTRNSLKAVRP